MGRDRRASAIPPRLWSLLVCAALVMLPGCVRGTSRETVSSLVPPNPWHQKTESQTIDESVAKVTANQIDVPLTETISGNPGIAHVESQPTDDPVGLIDGAAAPPQQIATGPWDAGFPGELDPAEMSALASPEQPFDQTTQPASASDPDQRIQQLKAALTADAELLENEQVAEAQRHPLQLRAEALAGWAQQLFQLGQLNEARRAAQQAVDLSETANLDYLPNEDRPRDLLHRIESALNQRHDAPSAMPAPDELAALSAKEMQQTDIPESSLVEARDDATQPTTALQATIDLEQDSDDVTGQVTANRPVEAVEEEHESPVRDVESPWDRPAELVALSPHVPTDLQPLPALPPFLGAASELPETSADNTTTTAPAPPELAEPEPFPSISGTSSALAPPAVHTPDDAPRQSLSRALCGSGIALAGIFCVVGTGLLIRKSLEQRRNNSSSAAV